MCATPQVTLALQTTTMLQYCIYSNIMALSNGQFQHTSTRCSAAAEKKIFNKKASWPLQFTAFFWWILDARKGFIQQSPLSYSPKTTQKVRNYVCSVRKTNRFDTKCTSQKGKCGLFNNKSGGCGTDIFLTDFIVKINAEAENDFFIIFACPEKGVVLKS